MAKPNKPGDSEPNKPGDSDTTYDGFDDDCPTSPTLIPIDGALIEMIEADLEELPTEDLPPKKEVVVASVTPIVDVFPGQDRRDNTSLEDSLNFNEKSALAFAKKNHEVAEMPYVSRLFSLRMQELDSVERTFRQFVLNHFRGTDPKTFEFIKTCDFKRSQLIALHNTALVLIERNSDPSAIESQLENFSLPSQEDASEEIQSLSTAMNKVNEALGPGKTVWKTFTDGSRVQLAQLLLTLGAGFAGGFAGYQILKEDSEAVDGAPTVQVDPIPVEPATIVPQQPELDASASSASAPSLPIETTPYEAILNVSDDPLTVAVLNDALVRETLKDAHKWTDVMPLLKNTHGAYREMRHNMHTWGGYQAVEASIDAFNASLPEGGNVIDTPREVYARLASDPQLPHAAAVALRVSKHMASDPDLTKDPAATGARNKAAQEKLPELLNTTEVKAPKPFHYEFDFQVDEKEPSDSLGSLEPTLDPYAVPEPRFVKAFVASTEVAVPAHEGLLALADQMEGKQEALRKMARGRNRERIEGFCTATSADLKELSSRFNGLSDSAKEIALLDLKQKYFARLENTLVRGDRNYYSTYLRTHAQEYLAQLSSLLPEVPESAGVEGIQGRVKNEVLATLPEGFFRA